VPASNNSRVHRQFDFKCGHARKYLQEQRSAHVNLTRLSCAAIHTVYQESCYACSTLCQDSCLPCIHTMCKSLGILSSAHCKMLTTKTLPGHFQCEDRFYCCLYQEVCHEKLSP
jgi:hypothetical protein